MPEQTTIEQRLAILEREVRGLKAQLNPDAASEQNWVQRVSGSMVDFPEFDEVVRLGRENRRVDSPATENDKS